MLHHDLVSKPSLLSPKTFFRLYKSQLEREIVRLKIEYCLDTIRKDRAVEVNYCKDRYTLSRGQDILDIILQTAPPETQSVLRFALVPSLPTEILVLKASEFDSSRSGDLLELIDAEFSTLENVLSAADVKRIVDSLPLLKFVSPEVNNEACFSNFALIWRDHFLEENIALLQSFERAGITPKWIFALSKGDHTAKSSKIAGYFRTRGYKTDLLDSTYPTPQMQENEISRITAALEAFIGEARQEGKIIMAIDDGGLLFYCFRDRQEIFDFAVEVTIVGTKRLSQLPALNIPIFDVGRSKLKEIITYPEIAESGVMRVREMIRDEKLRGRNVLVLGYGTSGRQVARIFQSIGCKVTVVDTNILALIEATENGYRTFNSAQKAILEVQPFLVFGCTGEIALTLDEFDALPDGSYITAIATKDLSELRKENIPYQVTPLPNFGYAYLKQDGSRFYQLGDGRSFNLFLSEAIPNKANDVFKAGIFVAARALSTCYDSLSGGIYVDPANTAIDESGLLQTYYDVYLRDKSANLTINK